MKVLVTGSTGFIGKHFIERAQTESGIEVIPFHREVPPSELPQFFEKTKPDAVVHLATLFLKHHQYEQIEPLITSNVMFTTQLLDCAQKRGTKHFIHFGSYHQFTESAEGKSQEVAATLYSASKAAAEPILEYYAVRQKLRVTQLYLYDTYGANDPRPKITNLLIQAAKTGEPLKLSEGKQTLKLLNVQDVCSAILHTLKLQAPAKNELTRYSVEPLDHCTLRELAAKIEAKAQKTIRAEWGAYPYPAGVPLFPHTPHPAIPGWIAQINLDQGLVDLFKMG